MGRTDRLSLRGGTRPSQRSRTAHRRCCAAGRSRGHPDSVRGRGSTAGATRGASAAGGFAQHCVSWPPAKVAHAGDRRRLRCGGRGAPGQPHLSHRVPEQDLRLHGMRPTRPSRCRRGRQRACRRHRPSWCVRCAEQAGRTRRCDSGIDGRSRRENPDGSFGVCVGACQRHTFIARSAVSFCHGAPPQGSAIATRIAGLPEGAVRPHFRVRGLPLAQPAPGRHRVSRRATRWTADPVPAGSAGPEREAIRDAEVPDHARGGRGQWVDR